ncbi:sporulation protein [bacterium]|nr:sporulation protein [bacterium]
MGIIDSFKRTFNISGADITIVLDDANYSQDDDVSGEVFIRGGELDQSGGTIKLELKEFWTEVRSDGKNTTTQTVYKTHESIILATAFTIPPKSEQHFQFNTKLPLNSRISAAGTGWQIWVSLDISGAVDPKGYLTFPVAPSEEIQAVLETCETSLRFTESENHRRWSNTTNEAIFRMIPPEILKPELDYMRVQLVKTDDGGLQGQLVFDLQEKSITDYFKALFNKDKVTVPLLLTHKQLLLSDGLPNTQAISEVIGTAMRKVISDNSR